MALLAHFQKLDVGINKQILTYTWVLLVGLVWPFFMVKSSKKVFES